LGKLSRAVRKSRKALNNTEIKGTIDEELWDVIYYAIAIANVYDIDLEQVIKAKEEMNQDRYPSSAVFEENR
jgi:NTP pyrophosphatase (non-canonical NTP hydrolase)